MISANIIATYFSINHRIIHMQTKGLTHEDSLIQLPFRGNCLNWVLGHIVSTRNNALILLGEEPIWSEEEEASYISKSEPITSDIQALSLEKILADLDTSQERLNAGLTRITEAELAVVEDPDGDDPRSVGEKLAGLFWHEAYHTGQTEYLRQLAGKDDKVI